MQTFCWVCCGLYSLTYNQSSQIRLYTTNPQNLETISDWIPSTGLGKTSKVTTWWLDTSREWIAGWSAQSSETRSLWRNLNPLLRSRRLSSIHPLSLCGGTGLGDENPLNGTPSAPLRGQTTHRLHRLAAPVGKRSTATQKFEIKTDN